jgi:hypothetical protein
MPCRYKAFFMPDGDGARALPAWNFLSSMVTTASAFNDECTVFNRRENVKRAS